MSYRPAGSIAGLSDVSTVGGPALTDRALVDRAGVSYNATNTEQIALTRKTPAGSRTAALPTVLTLSDMDKNVIVTGTTGAISVDGTVSDGFRCHVINTATGVATFTGMTGPFSVAPGGVATVMMGGATVYAFTATPGMVTLTNSGGSYATDASKGVTFLATLTATGLTLPNPTNLSVGQFYYWGLVQDATGSRTITTYGSLFDFGAAGTPTLSTGANVRDWIGGPYNGTKIDCSFKAGF